MFSANRNFLLWTYNYCKHIKDETTGTDPHTHAQVCYCDSSHLHAPLLYDTEWQATCEGSIAKLSQCLYQWHLVRLWCQKHAAYSARCLVHPTLLTSHTVLLTNYMSVQEHRHANLVKWSTACLLSVKAHVTTWYPHACRGMDHTPQTSTHVYTGGHTGSYRLRVSRVSKHQHCTLQDKKGQETSIHWGPSRWSSHELTLCSIIFPSCWQDTKRKQEEKRDERALLLHF